MVWVEEKIGFLYIYMEEDNFFKLRKLKENICRRA